MKEFTILWATQLISIMGTAMTRFALILWIYTETKNVTATALLGVFSMLPYALISPFSGIVADKYDRRKVMFLADVGAVIGTFVMFVLILAGRLSIEVIYISTMIAGVCEAFQTPAYTASITTMMPKELYTRANAMRSFSGNASRMFAPIFAGALVGIIGLKGIMFIDIISFFFGISGLLFVKIPKPIIQEEHIIHDMKITTVIKSFKQSYRYIQKKRGLITLMKIFVVINLITGMTYYGIFPAYILARTNNNQVVLGIVESLLGLGGVIGSVLVGTVVLKVHKIKIIFYSMLISYITGDILLAIGTHMYIWGIAVFITSISIAFVIANETTLWQVNIEQGMQGRVFAFKQMVNILSMPIGFLLGGVLADNVFEPFMQNNTLIVEGLAVIVGQGDGSGMAVMFLLSGVIGILLSIYGLKSRKLQEIQWE